MSLYDKNTVCNSWISYVYLSQWDKAHTEALKKTLKFYNKQCLCEVKPIINWNVTWYTFGNFAETQNVKKNLLLDLSEIEVVVVYNWKYINWESHV